MTCPVIVKKLNFFYTRMLYVKVDWKWPEFETIFSTRQVFFFHQPTPLSSPIRKGHGPSFEQTWIAFTDADALCQV